MNKRISVFILFSVLLSTVISCDYSSEPYVESTNVAVTSFSISANTDVLASLDSVYFTIDLMSAKIYNADSMPIGTDVSKLVLNIGLPTVTSAYLYISKSENSNDTIIDYATYYTDTIDCSGDLQLLVTSEDGLNSRVYDIMVNVHQQEPDSLFWSIEAKSDLPSTLIPEEQRTVKFQESAYCLIKNVAGAYTVGVSSHPSVVAWEVSDVNFSFTPNIKTFTAADNAMYILSESGELYYSTDAITWNTTSQVWYNILGGYGDELLGVIKVDNEYYHVGYPTGGVSTVILDDFPIDGASQMVIYETEWSVTAQGMIAGGVDKYGELIGDVWGYDGSRWAMLTLSSFTPLKDVTLFSYYTYNTNNGNWDLSKHITWFILGGRDESNSVTKDVYISQDLGLIWEKADTLVQLPDYIPAFDNAQALVYTVEYSAPSARSSSSSSGLLDGWELTPSFELPKYYEIVLPETYSSRAATQTWECPYIYLFGGEDNYGSLYDTIWKGLIYRLEYQPLL